VLVRNFTRNFSNQQQRPQQPLPSLFPWKPTPHLLNLPSKSLSLLQKSFKQPKSTKWKEIRNFKINNTHKQQKVTVKLYFSIQTMQSTMQIGILEPLYYPIIPNRAAAYSHLGLHEKAIEDCKASIAKNPSYSKAYGRLGLAYFSLGKFNEAVEAYRKGIELDPTSQALKESLAAAESKLKGESPATTTVRCVLFLA
jgi:tetratricopeptide (TPR) repeat protein